ncbi:hypothetical protein [Nitrospira sp. Nam80]
MESTMQFEEPSLTHKQIQAEVLKRLEKYKKLNFFEQFAMFMGLAQVFEISLKQLLHRRYGVEFEKLERATLGQVTGQLRDRGLRPDFIALLESVVGYRNHIAHSLLANQIMLQSLGAGDARFERRELEKGIFELEQLWFLFEWTEEPNAWG